MADSEFSFVLLFTHHAFSVRMLTPRPHPVRKFLLTPASLFTPSFENCSSYSIFSCAPGIYQVIFCQNCRKVLVSQDTLFFYKIPFSFWCLRKGLNPQCLGPTRPSATSQKRVYLCTAVPGGNTFLCSRSLGQRLNVIQMKPPLVHVRNEANTRSTYEDQMRLIIY